MFEPLTTKQRAVLDGLLQFDHPGVEELRRQAESARVQNSCTCGCPSVGFEDAPASSTGFASVWPIFGWRVAGPLEVILFVNHGRLVDMELITFDGPTPPEWPDVSEFTFEPSVAAIPGSRRRSLPLDPAPVALPARSPKLSITQRSGHHGRAGRRRAPGFLGLRKKFPNSPIASSIER